MKNYFLRLPMAGLALLACVYSCAPAGKLVMVKAHPSTTRVVAAAPKNQNKVQAIVSKTLVMAVSPILQPPLVSNNKVRTFSTPENGLVQSSRPLKSIVAVSHASFSIIKQSTHRVTTADQGYGRRGVGGALALMIIGVLLTLFFAVNGFGYLIGIAGCILFIIGVIDLVLIIV